jgi:hypothetical protein
MIPELSGEQRQVVKEHPGIPVVLMDPDTQARYVLIPAETYSRLRALLTDDAFHIEEAYPLMDQLASEQGWDDPALDVYNKFDHRKKP